MLANTSFTQFLSSASADVMNDATPEKLGIDADLSMKENYCPTPPKSDRSISCRMTGSVDSGAGRALKRNALSDMLIDAFESPISTSTANTLSPTGGDFSFSRKADLSQITPRSSSQSTTASACFTGPAKVKARNTIKLNAAAAYSSSSNRRTVSTASAANAPLLQSQSFDSNDPRSFAENQAESSCSLCSCVVS